MAGGPEIQRAGDMAAAERKHVARIDDAVAAFRCIGKLRWRQRYAPQGFELLLGEFLRAVGPQQVGAARCADEEGAAREDSEGHVLRDLAHGVARYTARCRDLRVDAMAQSRAESSPSR